MKKGPIITILLLLLLCSCTKQVVQEPPFSETQHTQIPPVAAPPAYDEHTISQNDAQDISVTPELLQKRLEYASLCSCLMEQGARWHLIQVGTLEETEEDAPFLSALAAFEEALTAHPKEFATVAEDTLWLLDSGPEGGITLQFLQTGPENTLSCRSLVFDGETVSWQKEAEQWDSPHWAVCANATTDAERQRILERYDNLSRDDLQSRFWRVSMTHGNGLALTALSMDEAWADVFYPVAQMGGRLLLNAEDIVPTEADELALSCLRVTPDSSVVDADEITLLRSFLAASLLARDIPWDAPVPLSSEYSCFYNVRNALLLLLRDLRADDTLKEAFLCRENWILTWDAGFEYILTAQGTQDSLTAHLYPAGIDVEGYQTPSRKKLNRLAQEGENSDLVPEKVREQFVLAVLRHLEYGRMMSGEFGEATWAWREIDGEIQLEVDVMMDDGTEIPLTARFVPDASGEPVLTVLQ